MSVEGVILAGQRNSGALREVSDEEWEALIKIGDKPIVQYVIDSLRASREIERVIVVGPVQDLTTAGIGGEGVELVQSRDSMIENLMEGAGHCRSDLVLVSTSDIPMVTPEIVDRFIADCLKAGDYQFYYPIVSKEVSEKSYPLVKRTYARLKDGTFTGGNMVLLDRRIIEKSAQRAMTFFEYRKSPFKMASVLGVGFLFRAITHNLTIAEAEKRVRDLLGITAKAVISSDAEIGIDVDKPSDLKLAKAALL